jgi:hypothetical protein
MPLPKIIRTPEEIALQHSIVDELIAAGVIQLHKVSSLPETARTEMPCFDARGLVSPRTFQPMTVTEWLADCKRRNITPVCPNR